MNVDELTLPCKKSISGCDRNLVMAVAQYSLMSENRIGICLRASTLLIMSSLILGDSATRFTKSVGTNEMKAFLVFLRKIL